MRALPLLAVLVLCACGGEAAAPQAAPSPTPSPAPPPVLFEEPALRAALLADGEVLGLTAPPTPDARDDAVQMSLCNGERAAPRVTAGAVSLSSTTVFGLNARQEVEALPDEAVARALLDDVARHAETCVPREDTVPPEAGGGVVRTREEAVVPFSRGAWTGVRQSAVLVATGRGRTTRQSIQTVVVRRSNAVLLLRVQRQDAAPDLAAVLDPVLAKLDAAAR